MDGETLSQELDLEDNVALRALSPSVCQPVSPSHITIKGTKRGRKRGINPLTRKMRERILYILQ